MYTRLTVVALICLPAVAPTDPAAAAECVNYAASSPGPTTSSNGTGPRRTTAVPGAAALGGPAGITQIQGGFDGKPSVASTATGAVVVVTMFNKSGGVVHSCNGVQYAPGLIATNNHCVADAYDSISVDFGLLTHVSAAGAGPDYHGEYRCPATRDPYRAKTTPDQITPDVAVVRVAAIPAPFETSVTPFDPQGGVGKPETTAPAFMTHYWLDPDATVPDEQGKPTSAVHLTKYDQGPPSCKIYWTNDKGPCVKGQIIHYCDSGEGSSGAPFYGTTPFQTNDLRQKPVYLRGLNAIALNSGGVPDHGNCAVPAAQFANGLPAN